MAYFINQFLENYSIITLHGNKEIYIENFKSIISITDNIIRIKANNTIITISGSSLHMEYYNNYDIKIHGIINKIAFGENDNE